MSGRVAPGPPPAWSLPDLMIFSGSDWVAYEDAIYLVFCEDFIYHETRWHGLAVKVRYEPSFDNKGDTFWHCVTQVTEGSTRDPDFRRCERIRWIRALLEAPEAEVCTWAEQRPGGERMVIALPDFSFLVVIRPVPVQGRAQLITAYHIESEGRRNKYRREYEAAAAAVAAIAATGTHDAPK